MQNIIYPSKSILAKPLQVLVEYHLVLYCHNKVELFKLLLIRSLIWFQSFWTVPWLAMSAPETVDAIQLPVSVSVPADTMVTDASVSKEMFLLKIWLFWIILTLWSFWTILTFSNCFSYLKLFLTFWTVLKSS